MKRALIFTGLCFLFVGVTAQCTLTAGLNVAGTYCAGSVTLAVAATNTPQNIVWYKGNSVISTVTASSAGSGVTIAGGNGDGQGAGQLEGPESVCMDKAGNIYISDAANYRVQKWARGARSGTTVAGGNGQGIAANQLDGHASIFVDANENLFVADASDNRIQLWAPGATSGITVAGGNGQGGAANQFNDPEGVFVDGQMNIYVADAGNNRVQEWAPGAVAGVTVAGGNGQGAAASQFNVSSNLCVDQTGNIFVADAGNSRVQRWAPGAAVGVTVAGGNGQGGGAAQLDGPEAVYVDAGDTVYVADLINNRIQKWAPGAGSGITVAGGNGLGLSASQLAHPYSVCVDQSRNIYVADFGNDRIQKWAQGAAIDTLYKPGTAGVYSALVTDGAGCSVTTNTITINPAPSVIAGNDTIIGPGQAVKLQPSVTGNIVTYRWTPSAGLNDPSIAEAVARPTHSTSYQLAVTTDEGCSAGGKVYIQVYYTLSMPNAFTPNGDGENDLFRIPAATPQHILSFSIYDRKGRRVFLTADAGEGWNGTFNNQPQPAGVYIWEIGYEDILSGRMVRAAGTVALIR